MDVNSEQRTALASKMQRLEWYLQGRGKYVQPALLWLGLRAMSWRTSMKCLAGKISEASR